MDNITHTLIGVTLVRAGLGRRTAGSMATMVVASNAPDLDIVTAVTGGAVRYLAVHRGPTHGIAGVVLLGLAVALGVWLVQRRGRLRLEQSQRRSLAVLMAVGLAGTCLHVLMDLPTSYGTRLLSPFDDTWFAFDWLPIVDVYLWALLLSGLVVTRLRPERCTTIARVVVAGAMLFYVGRAAAHQRALDLAATLRADGRTSPCATAPVLTRHPAAARSMTADSGACIQAAALPTLFSPFRWQLIRQQADGYEVRELSLLSGRRTQRFWVPTERNRWIEAAARTTTAQVFLDFARLPAARSVPLPDGTREVRLIDVRFVSGPFRADAPPTRSVFLATVVLAPNGAVRGERLGQ